MSNTHSLIQRITASISGRSSSTSGVYNLTDFQYNYAIGGVPLLSATTDGPGYGISSRPDVEQPVEQRKEQFDNYKDPGEYSLSQWWLRSQSSFIGGAGVIYQDPDTQGASKNLRFYRSVGIDPFSDSDNLQLLHEMQRDATFGSSDPNTGKAYVLGSIQKIITDTGYNDRMWVAKGSNVWLRNCDVSSLTAYGNVPLTTSSTFEGWIGGIVEFADFTTNTLATPYNSHWMYGFLKDGATPANAGIWKVKAGSGVMTPTRVYLPPTDQTQITVGKARGLLAFTQANKLYMLDPYAAAGTALPAANAQVPKDQVITAVADGPDGVYVAANSATQGYIYVSTFDNITGVVNGLTLTATLPAGERVNFINSYVNTFMVISTTTGIRVGQFTGSGVSYGASLISVPTTGYEAGPEGNSGFGRSVFFGTRCYVTTLGTPQHDGDFGLMCVDLGTVNTDQNTGASLNAYCNWTYFAGTPGPVWSVAVTATGRTVTTSDLDTNAKVDLESGFSYMTTGYLDTGRCRFNTMEPKLFKFVSLRTPVPLQGEVTLSLLSEGGGNTTYVTYGPSLTPDTNDVSTPIPVGPQNWIALRFTLRRNPSAFNQTAKLDAWQIKALPGTLKQRVITKQFLLFNQEKDKGGQIIQRSALDRLAQIRQMCQRGDTVTFQDLVNNTADQVIIQNYTFTMLAPPGPNAENYGGYLTLELRTVADSVPPLTLPSTVEP